MSKIWLDKLQEKIAGCWECHSPAIQFGFCYIKPEHHDDYWEVWAYPAVQEIVGGKANGETVWSGFHFDILRFLTDFEPDAVALSTTHYIEPSELTIEGKFRGRGVFLHLCLEPPEDAEATEILDIRGEGGPIVRDKE